jgi:acyl carrier protein
VTAARDAVLATLRAQLAVVRAATPADLAADVSLKEELQMDSLDLVEFVARVEEHYRVSVPDDDWRRLATLGDIADFLTSRIS